MAVEQDRVFRAIADPTRRMILERLSAAPGGTPIGQLAESFSTSRQAVTKHVKMLETARLVRIEKSGRERRCVADLARLRLVYDWVNVYRQFWTEKLDALGTFLDEEAAG